jgi:hypothetical protein
VNESSAQVVLVSRDDRSMRAKRVHQAKMPGMCVSFRTSYTVLARLDFSRLLVETAAQRLKTVHRSLRWMEYTHVMLCLG